MNPTLITEAKELVVPLDGREASVRAVPVARSLAERLGLGVRLFSVGDDSELKNWLDDVAARLLDGIEVATEVRAGGDPERVIVEVAGDGGLVCMATAASILPHEGHVGSVAEQVVRATRRPVVLVGPEVALEPGKRTQRIVVPVDGSELSESVVGVAGDLARVLDVPAWVVTVVTPEAEKEAAAELGQVSPVVESAYVSRIARRMRADFGIDAEFEVLHLRDEADAIVEFAGDDGLVVMCTHGRSGLSRLFGGSVATAVVARSRRPVVVWRPDDA